MSYESAYAPHQPAVLAFDMPPQISPSSANFVALWIGTVEPQERYGVLLLLLGLESDAKLIIGVRCSIGTEALEGLIRRSREDDMIEGSLRAQVWSCTQAEEVELTLQKVHSIFL